MDQGTGTEQRVVILGAGPTGLGAALRLHELGLRNVHVYDMSDRVGGLATSFVDEQGFTWDIGGHVQFSHYRYFDELMERALPGQWLTHERESWVWINERFVPYPFQNNLRYLSPVLRWKCLQGLIRLYKQPILGRPANFAEWIDATFGAGLAEVFMVPYNFKVWAFPATDMSYDWIGERVAVTDLERVLDNVMHDKDDLSWGPNHTFRFPTSGGTGAIWEQVANIVGREHISLGRKVVRIDVQARRVHFDDETVVPYDTLFSTLPIDQLVELAGLSDLRPHAAKLKYSSSNIIGVGLSGQPPAHVKGKCWMYFPESDCPFYRVTLFSHYSPANVPDPTQQWSLMAEVSESPHKPVSQDLVVEQTIAGFKATGLMTNEHQVISRWQYRAHYGYPTPALGRDDALRALHAGLEPHGIFSRGRFGGWKYEVSNQDHSLMQGVEWANKLVMAVPEVTYPFPNTANNLAYAKNS